MAHLCETSAQALPWSHVLAQSCQWGSEPFFLVHYCCYIAALCCNVLNCQQLVPRRFHSYAVACYLYARSRFIGMQVKARSWCIGMQVKGFTMNRLLRDLLGLSSAQSVMLIWAASQTLIFGTQIIEATKHMQLGCFA